MLLQLDPTSPSGVSVAPPQQKLNRGGFAGSPDITRVIQPGMNVTFTGNGTQQSPYVVSATGGSGSSPLTTKGDLYGRSTVDARIPVGADGTVLTADSSQTLGVKWGAAGSGSGITRTVIVTSGAYTVGATASTDYVYLIAGLHAGTLPTASGNSDRYTFKNNHSANVTVTRAGSDTVEGATSISIAPNDSVDLISNNTSAWSVI